MENKISGEITDVNLTALEAIPAAIAAELPFLITLTVTERKYKRKMATKNTGYVADVYAGAKAHTDVLPGSFDFAEFTKDMNLKTRLQYVKQIFVSVVEKIDDTDLQLGNELMKQSDKCYSHLKLAAKDNTAVKEIVDQIATAYSGIGKKKPAAIYTITAGGSITVYKVVTKTSLVNHGTTVIRIQPGSEILQKVMSMTPIEIEPHNSVIVPDDWTVVQVTNLSTTAEASFSVKVKA